MQRENVAPGNVTLYPQDWATIQQFAQDRGYPSASAALRRIIDEWRMMKARQFALASDAACYEEMPQDAAIRRLTAPDCRETMPVASVPPSTV